MFEAFIEGARTAMRTDFDQLEHPEDVSDELRESFNDWRENDAE